MLIVISDAFGNSLPDRLSRFGEVTDHINRIADAEVVLIRSKTKVTKEYIDAAPNLKLVIRGGVGLDNVDLEYASEKGIEVHNTPAASAIAVAECAFALMIGITNHIARADSSMRDGKWIKKDLKRTELYRKTLGIIGLGRIGTELAKRGDAFGMTVVAYDPFVKNSDYADVKPEMKDVLHISDYVSLHLPLIESTRGIINSETLKEFKDGSFLINTGRGKTIVEEDVAKALVNGKLAGFGNDVWYSDPPAVNPFADLPNVLMMPHLGASTKENLSRIGEIVENLISEFVKN
jgi:D-3-phosphoglycerate dehydrogenase